jgi:hypothetical protein
MARPTKDALLVVRLSAEDKAGVERLAARRGESTAVIVREALRDAIASSPVEEVPRST